MKAEGSRPPTTEAAYGGDGGFGGQYSGDGDNGPRGNNYSRPSGQNVRAPFKAAYVASLSTVWPPGQWEWP